MLLLGERDIYDFAVGRDTDKRYTYTRSAFTLSDLYEPAETPNNAYLSSLKKYSFHFGWKNRVERKREPLPAFFVFCGNIYHCTLLPSGQVVWKSEEVLAYCDEVGLVLRDDSWDSDYYTGITAESLNEFLTPKKLTKDVNEWLIANKVVQAFMVQRHFDSKLHWWPNKNLIKDIGFVKVMEPFAIYQEIEQFVTSTLVSEGNNMVTLNDKHKRDKAGFDDKSFKHRK